MAIDEKKRLVRIQPRQHGKAVATGRVRAVQRVQTERIPQAMGAQPPNRPPVDGGLHIGDAPRGPWDRELVKAIAMDIGKDTVAYIEVMYPKAIEATSSTFKLSIRNHIYNQIMAAIEVTDEGQVVGRLSDRKKWRREWTSIYRKLRQQRDAPSPKSPPQSDADA